MASQRKRIVHLADPTALAARASEELTALANAAIAERGAFRVALAGGSTPKLLYERLAEASESTEFAKWHVYFGDERNVPPEHADSNFRMAQEAWLARGKIPGSQIHRIHGEFDAFKAAADYEREIGASFGSREVPRFDLILLGLGTDGHTASLFPGTTAITESRAIVVSTWVERLSTQRITLTLRTINAAHAVFFLVAGADKAETLRNVLHDVGEPTRLPARLIKPWDGSVTWFVDRAAAAKLSEL